LRADNGHSVKSDGDLTGRLRQGRGDGALVRLSTPLIGVDRDAARGMLVSFARVLEPKLGEAWPSEAPLSEGAAAAR
jgi:hypothetical protein